MKFVRGLWCPQASQVENRHWCPSPDLSRKGQGLPSSAGSQKLSFQRVSHRLASTGMEDSVNKTLDTTATNRFVIEI